MSYDTTPKPFDRDYYGTTTEISFIRELAVNRPEAFRKYAALVLSGMRLYDRTVDVDAVKAAIGNVNLLFSGISDVEAGRLTPLDIVRKKLFDTVLPLETAK